MINKTSFIKFTVISLLQEVPYLSKVSPCALFALQAIYSSNLFFSIFLWKLRFNLYLNVIDIVMRKSVIYCIICLIYNESTNCSDRMLLARAYLFCVGHDLIYDTHAGRTKDRSPITTNYYILTFGDFHT